MKILVLSDSHSGLHFMRLCIEKVQPDEVIHLGDFYEDGHAMAEENPGIPFHLLAGNCDYYRYSPCKTEILQETIGGVRFYMTHGHKHNVKTGTLLLLMDAALEKADVVLYGHTHIPVCRRAPNGMWVMNPGTSRSDGGSAGLIEIEHGKILKCRILNLTDLEEM